MHVLHIYPRTYIEVGLLLCSSATAASVYDVKNHNGTVADGSVHVHARKSACEVSLNKQVDNLKTNTSLLVSPAQLALKVNAATTTG